ncbi:MAG TPA: hypothetical protein VGE13_04660 [Candidatus Saccharimonadales bacterium]
MVEQARATKKQQLLLEFVDEFIKEHDYGPSYREIMAALGYKSVSTVAVHVEALITKGFLERSDNSARSLSVVGRTETKPSQNTEKPTALQLLTEKIDELLANDSKEDAEILVSALRVFGYIDEANTYGARLEEKAVRAEN